MYEIWNEFDADDVRNLYKNYTNRLLDVIKYQSCNDALLENKIELKMLYYLMFVLLFKKPLFVRSFFRTIV